MGSGVPASSNFHGLGLVLKLFEEMNADPARGEASCDFEFASRGRRSGGASVSALLDGVDAHEGPVEFIA
jgi:hypothetical protein